MLPTLGLLGPRQVMWVGGISREESFWGFQAWGEGKEGPRGRQSRRRGKEESVGSQPRGNVEDATFQPQAPDWGDEPGGVADGAKRGGRGEHPHHLPIWAWMGGAESQPQASLKGGGAQEGREGGAGSTEHGQAATCPPHRAALAPSRSSSSLRAFFHSGRLRTFLPHSQFSNGTFFFSSPRPWLWAGAPHWQ